MRAFNVAPLVFFAAHAFARERSAAACTWWYETTPHGSGPSTAFRNALDYGAAGDGVTDDTAALLRALNENQTGATGSGLAKSARVVYLPHGTYLIRDTLVLWFWTTLQGNPLPGCASTLLLAPGSPGFNDSSSLKPLLAANGGFNSTAADGAWWRVDRTFGGHANDLFYTSLRDVGVRVGAGNAGAVAVFFPVAQQTSIRNVGIDLTAGGAIGVDFAGTGYAARFLPTGAPSWGGGGLVDRVTVTGGALGLRLAGSQWTYSNVVLRGQSAACVWSSAYIWTHVFVNLSASFCPAALRSTNAAGSILLLDSVLGPGLGASAIATDGAAGLYLQNVALAPPAPPFVVDGVLPAPAAGAPIAAWARGPAFAGGARVDANASGRFLPLPSRSGAAAAGLPLACAGTRGAPNLCGGSSEDPATGIDTRARPSFAGGGEVVANAVADFGAVGDGIADDTAALQAALGRPNSITFLPFGTYRVGAPGLALGCNATIVGEALSALALAGGAAPGPLPLQPLPPRVALLTTAEGAGCSAGVADVALTSLGVGNEGAALLWHRGGAASGFWDAHMRVVFAVGLKAVVAGSGLFSNAWWWGMDHNLTDQKGMNCSDPACVDHRPVGQLRGVEFWPPAGAGVGAAAAAGATTLLGTNFEHSAEVEYNFTSGVANVVATAIQTEGSQVSLTLAHTAAVALFGTLFGSGVGHNATAYATREALCAGGVDAAYRIVGHMVKQPLNFSLVDSSPPPLGFAAPAPVSASGWEYVAAMYNEC